MHAEPWTVKMGLLIIAMGVGSMILMPFVEAESPKPAEAPSLQQQTEALQLGQQALRNELKTIKELLTARGKPRSPVEDISLTLNVADAPLTLVEYTDYQCPYCARHSQNVLPQLVKYFIETGKIRYVLRDFPLASIHPHAGKAHEAAHCGGEQDKYWELHDQLFAHQKALQADKLAGYTTTAGVADAAVFQACLDSGKYETQTKAGVTDGNKVGVRGTPSFALGRTAADGTVKAVKLIRGAQGLPAFQKQIAALLAAKGEKAAQP